MRVAILQSNYIPWKGYFDLINSVDVFVIYDDMQYTKNDWRNRNRIKTSQGVQWLTIPVRVRSLSQRINETCVSDIRWSAKHWRSLCQSYTKAPCFNMYKEGLEHLYNVVAPEIENLSDINVLFLEHICNALNINTKIVRSSEFTLAEGKSERVLGLCKELGADVYVSGPAARDYLDVDLFASENVSVEWVDYSGYPVYPQLHGSFEHAVTILDLILNVGPDAPQYMKSYNKS